MTVYSGEFYSWAYKWHHLNWQQPQDEEDTALLWLRWGCPLGDLHSSEADSLDAITDL